MLDKDLEQERNKIINESKSHDDTSANPNSELLNVINNSNNDKYHSELLKQISMQAVQSNHRINNVKQLISHENERINRLAEVYQKEIISSIKKDNLMKVHQHLSEEHKVIYMKAITKIQSIFRRKIARNNYLVIKSRNKVLQALETLLSEINNNSTSNKKDSNNKRKAVNIPDINNISKIFASTNNNINSNFISNISNNSILLNPINTPNNRQKTPKNNPIIINEKPSSSLKSSLTRKYIILIYFNLYI